jgi:AraC family transcriptional regulator, arabinose operon regulatory protein
VGEIYFYGDEMMRATVDERIAMVLELMVTSQTGSVPVKSVAAVTNLSPSRLRHLFKEEVGTSFHRYGLLLRLERVRLLLCTTDCTVKEAARMVGFMDLSNLTNAFKRTYGATPGALRAIDSNKLEREE